MKNSIVKYEINKGYIPYDKVTVRGEHFENFSFSVDDLKQKKDKVQKEYLKDIYNADKNLLNYTFEHLTQEFLVLCGYSFLEDIKIKVFYFNVNHDGIQLFINRGFESKRDVK